MAVLQSTNVQGSLCVNGVAVGGGKDFKYCCFTASSTFTPSQDLVDGDGAVDSFQVAGGGGGGGIFNYLNNNHPNTSCCMFAQMGGGPGGGGSMANTLEDIDSTTTCTVTVGAGGTGGGIGMAVSCNDYDASIVTPAGNGGDSSFGENTVVGGGAGASFWTCWCYREGSFLSKTQHLVGGDRNGSIGFTNCGGANGKLTDAKILSCSCGVTCCAGSSYVEAIPTVLWSEGRKNYINNQTGSGVILNSFNNPNGIINNGVPLGAGGYAPTLGCMYDGYSGSNETSFHDIEDYENQDLDILNGVIATGFGTTRNEIFNQTWATASNYPEKYYGVGGKAGVSIHGMQAGCGPLKTQINGGSGNDGIVVLKWYE